MASDAHERLREMVVEFDHFRGRHSFYIYAERREIVDAITEHDEITEDLERSRTRIKDLEILASERWDWLQERIAERQKAESALAALLTEHDEATRCISQAHDQLDKADIPRVSKLLGSGIEDPVSLWNRVVWLRERAEELKRQRDEAVAERDRAQWDRDYWHERHKQQSASLTTTESDLSAERGKVRELIAERELLQSTPEARVRELLARIEAERVGWGRRVDVAEARVRELEQQLDAVKSSGQTAFDRAIQLQAECDAARIEVARIIEQKNLLLGEAKWLRHQLQMRDNDLADCANERDRERARTADAKARVREMERDAGIARRIAEVATRHGWDGVENPKRLDRFVEQELARADTLATENHELRVQLAQSQSARERELADECQRLREANRRLQAQGEELERDKLVRQLRERITELERDASGLAAYQCAAPIPDEGGGWQCAKDARADAIAVELAGLREQLNAARQTMQAWLDQWARSEPRTPTASQPCLPCGGEGSIKVYDHYPESRVRVQCQSCHGTGKA